MKITFTTKSGTLFESNENGTYFYMFTLNDKGILTRKRIKKAEFEAAQRENELERDMDKLDEAAENPEVTLEEFCDMVATDADLYCRHPYGTDLDKPAVIDQYGCVDCSDCNVQDCVHRNCMRRNPVAVGGLSLCPRYATTQEPKAEELPFDNFTEEDNEAFARMDEEIKNGGPKAKKAKKTRKSKDIAYTYYESDDKDARAKVLFTLTAKQVDFIKHLPDTYFWEEGIESTIWVDCLCDDIEGQFAGKPMTVGAMISTLCEKGLGSRATERKNGKKCTSFRLTELGMAVAIDLGLR